MGTVSYLPGSRRPVTDVGAAGPSHATEATAPNLPAVPDPLEGEILPPRTAPTDRKPKRRPKPAWLGFSARHRAALRSAIWYRICQCAGRTWWEVRQGIWVRLWHLLRWFMLGLRDACIDLPRWTFAVDERADIRRTRPGALRGTPPGRNAQIGARVDRSWKLRLGFVLVANVGAWFAAWYFIPPPVELFSWVTSAKVAWICWGVPWFAGLTLYGWMHDEKPPAPVVAPRERQDVNITAMNDALRSVGILAKPTDRDPTPDGVRLAAHPKSTGNAGQETVFDLPASCGKSAADVIKERDRIAAAFATPRDRFVIELGVHEAQFSVWTSPRDPFAGKLPEHPLMRVGEWNVWDRYPFSHDVRGDHVHYSVPLTSDLTGSRPRRGKSYAVRSKLVGAVLDPYVHFHVFDGKGGATWGAPPSPKIPDAPKGTGLYPIAENFIEGSDHEDVARVMVALEGCVADMRERARRIPGSVVNRDLSRDPLVDAPITVVIVDEAQRYIGHKDHGKRIVEALVTLAQTGPSTGYALFVITQRPDADSFPSDLRAVMGSRLALQVMSHMDSNVILGPDKSKLGHDASKINHRGVGIYVPDDDADGHPDDDPGSTQMVRMFDMSDDKWAAICETGTELREERTDRAAPAELTAIDPDDEMLPAAGLLSRLRTYAPDALPDQVIDGKSLGEWLTAKHQLRAVSIGNQRMRSVAATEVALGLLAGCLRGQPEQPSSNLPATPEQPTEQPLEATPSHTTE